MNSHGSTPSKSPPVKKKEVIFIVLSSSNKNRVVCDLVEKLFLMHKHLLLYVQDEIEARKYDQLLWTWKQSSFIPHVYDNEFIVPHEETIVITSQKGIESEIIKSDHGYDVCVMVDPVPFPVVDYFRQVIDFAEKYDQSRLIQSRERYKRMKSDDVILKTMQPGEFLSAKM